MLIADLRRPRPAQISYQHERASHHAGFAGIGGFFLAKLLGSVARRCSPRACRRSLMTCNRLAGC